MSEYKSDYFDCIHIDEIHQIPPFEIPREWKFDDHAIDRAAIGTFTAPPGFTEGLLNPTRRKWWLLQWFEDKIAEMHRDE